MSDIKIVRMLSGEDVLCDVVAQDLSHVVVRNAVVIIPTQQESVTFTPYAPFVKRDAEIALNTDMVVFVEEPDHQFVDQHKKMFGGIVTPNQSIVI